MKMETKTIDTSVLPLGDNEFETGVLAAVPANGIVKAGTCLKRDGEKFAVLKTPASEKVAAIEEKMPKYRPPFPQETPSMQHALG